MFISTHRFNPFEELDNSFDSFWNEDLFNPFSFLAPSKKQKLSKEGRLKKQLNRLQNEENDIAHYIKQYEQQLEQLKRNKENVQNQRTKVTEKITKIVEEKKNKKIENAPQDSNEPKPEGNSYVFKRVHYKTNDMEIEEQYDSSNPKNCYKIIRKQGEAPQIVQGEQTTHTIKNSNEKQSEQNKDIEEVQQTAGADNLDEKYEQLSKMVGKESIELKNLVTENKDLSIGQLFDKATELKYV